MDRIKLTVRSKVEGSTILEVLISMIVIMIVFGIAMMIFTNITQSSLSLKRITAESILNESLINEEKSSLITTQSFKAGDFSVEQNVKNYDNINNLFEVDMIAYDANRQVVAELRKVVINKDE